MSYKSATTALATTSTDSKIKYSINYCIKKGYFNLVAFLLKRGLEPNILDDQDRLCRNALIYCTYINELNWALSVAQSLLEYGASLQLRDTRGLNPLHYCCAFGKDRLLSLFLKSLDFDLFNCVDKNGNTCLHYAIKFRSVKCIRLLLDKFRQYNMEIIERRNNFGLFPTDMLTFDQKQGYQSNSEMIEICKCIIDCFKRPNNLMNDVKQQKLSDTRVMQRPRTAPSKTLRDTEQLFINEFELKLNSISYNPLCENKEYLVQPLHSFNYDINRFISTQETRTIVTNKRTSTAKSRTTPSIAYRPQSSRQSQRHSLLIESSVKDLSIFDDNDNIDENDYVKMVQEEPKFQENASHLVKLVGWKRDLQKILENLEIIESPSYFKSIKPPVNTQILNSLDEFMNTNDTTIDKNKLGTQKTTGGKQSTNKNVKSAASSMSNFTSVSRQVSAKK